jgi:hypothetical protein
MHVSRAGPTAIVGLPPSNLILSVPAHSQGGDP